MGITIELLLGTDKHFRVRKRGGLVAHQDEGETHTGRSPTKWLGSERAWLGEQGASTEVTGTSVALLLLGALVGFSPRPRMASRLEQSVWLGLAGNARTTTPWPALRVRGGGCGGSKEADVAVNQVQLEKVEPTRTNATNATNATRHQRHN